MRARTGSALRAAEREPERDRKQESDQKRHDQLSGAALFDDAVSLLSRRFMFRRCAPGGCAFRRRLFARGLLATHAFGDSRGELAAFCLWLLGLWLGPFSSGALASSSLGECLLFCCALLLARSLCFRLPLGLALLLVGGFLRCFMRAAPAFGVAALLLADAHGRRRSGDGRSDCARWTGPRGAGPRGVRAGLPRARLIRSWRCRLGRDVPISIERVERRGQRHRTRRFRRGGLRFRGFIIPTCVEAGREFVQLGGVWDNRFHDGLGEERPSLTRRARICLSQLPRNSRNRRGILRSGSIRAGKRAARDFLA